MPRVAVHTLDDAPEQTRPSLQTLAKSMGKLLNIHAEMAHSPVVLAAYTGIQDAIAEHGTFDAPTREAIALASARSTTAATANPRTPSAGRPPGSRPTPWSRCGPVAPPATTNSTRCWP